jgi:hypothetical protein
MSNTPRPARTKGAPNPYLDFSATAAGCWGWRMIYAGKDRR